MTTRKVTIHIPLLDEGTSVYRPTLGEMISEEIFKVLPTEDYDPEDEQWAFPPGKIVKCTKKMVRGEELLIATEEI